MSCPEPRGEAMRRRGKADGKAIKTQRRKTLKHRNAPKTVRRRSSLAAGEETNVEQLTRELAEAREREAATAEVLKVISATPGELEPVFQTMLENATRICEATFGTMLLAMKKRTLIGGLKFEKRSSGMPTKVVLNNRLCINLPVVG